MPEFGIEFLLCRGDEGIIQIFFDEVDSAASEAAAHHYFHTSAKKLTLQQSALITACYPNPLKWNPTKPTTYLNRRANAISGLTHKVGKIRFDDETIKKAHERYEKRNAERRAKKERKNHKKSDFQKFNTKKL